MSTNMMQPDVDAMTMLMSRMSDLMERQARRQDELEYQLQAMTDRLQSVAQQLPGVLRQSGNELVEGLRGQAAEQVRTGLSSAIDAGQQRLQSASSEAQQRTQALGIEFKQFQQLVRSLRWKLTATVVGSMLVLLGGAVWLSMHYAAVIRDNQVNADLMRTIRAADVSLCDGRLCAKVDAKAPRYGANREYVQVLLR